MRMVSCCARIVPRASSAVSAMVTSWTTPGATGVPTAAGVPLAEKPGMNTFKATLVLTLLLGCASPRPALRADRTPARLTDTPAEKLAAMPVPDPTADPENKDQRYGIE